MDLKMKIVVTEPDMMSGKVKVMLEEIGTVHYGPFEDSALPELLSDAEVLMVRLGRYIGDEVLSLAPKLRYLVSATTGVDHLDLKAAEAAGVRVVTLRECYDLIQDVSATAEHCWGLLLALIRSTTTAVTHVLSGGWDRNQFWGRQLRGKTLGIIGYGRIGRMLAVYGDAFGMKVLACDKGSEKIDISVKAVSLTELVKESDVITVNVNADPENHHLVDRDLISKFKKNSFFINTSRGMLVDNKALADAVYSSQLAGVAVDVLEGEEYGILDNDPLLECARSGHNILITPHIGGATRESIEQAESAVVITLHSLLKK